MQTFGRIRDALGEPLPLPAISAMMRMWKPTSALSRPRWATTSSGLGAQCALSGRFGAKDQTVGVWVVVLSDEMRQMVDAGLGFVAATINADGTPNLSPKGTLAVWDDDHLVFVDIASPNTSANLERNPSVEINVVDPLIRRGYRFAGTAVVHRGGSVFERGVSFYEDRGTVEARARVRAVVIIAVARVRSLRSPAYALGATEEDLKSRYRKLLLGDD